MGSNDPSERIRVAFILTELTLGGAEMMLWKLLSRIDRDRFEPFVIALSSRVDSLFERFTGLGIDCRLLGMRSRVDARALYRLVAVLREIKPHLVQGWMYYGNLAATFACAFVRDKPAVLWNIRGTLNLSQEKRLSVFVIWLGGKLSRLPVRIVNNSTVSAHEHEHRLGYSASRRVILPNGFDTEVFRPSADARLSVRQSLGLSSDTVLVGLIGRYHPMKDHETFLRAAQFIAKHLSRVHYVLAGDNVDQRNAELRDAVAKVGLNDRVHLLGRRDDLPTLMAALDLCVSSSSNGEGFPNVVGEAMSCGVPCVVTDVGDSALIVGETGFSVPPRDPAALGQAIVGVIESGEAARTALGCRARKRIMEHFSLDAVVRRYEDLYQQTHESRHPERAYT